MKYIAALLPLVLSGLTLTPMAEATTLFDCPFASMGEESLGLVFDVDVDTSNCNTEDIDSTTTALTEFIQISLTEVSGYTRALGEVEINLEGELCEEANRRNLLRGNTRELRLHANGGYIWRGGGGKYNCEYAGANSYWWF